MASIILSQVVSGQPSFPCGPCAPACPPDSATLGMVNSGITLAPNTCVTNSSGSGSLKFTLLSLPGSASLPFSSPTGWLFDDNGVYDDFNTYTNLTCAGAGGAGSGGTLFGVTCGSNKWGVYIFDDNLGALMFYATGTGVLPKNTAIANQLTAANQTPPGPNPFASGSYPPAFANSIGYGGNVTLSGW